MRIPSVKAIPSAITSTVDPRHERRGREGLEGRDLYIKRWGITRAGQYIDLVYPVRGEKKGSRGLFQVDGIADGKDGIWGDPVHRGGAL